MSLTVSIPLVSPVGALALGGCVSVKTSASTGDLQQELSSAVVFEAEVLIAQGLDDAVAQGALLKDQ